MKQLTIKELAAYLPYGLKIQWIDEAYTLVGFNKNTIYHDKGFFVELPHKLKMFLRPLSDLTKEIEHNGERFVPMERVLLMVDNYPTPETIQRYTLEMPYDVVDYLLSLHFDVFNLIPQGLAIDINTL